MDQEDLQNLLGRMTDFYKKHLPISSAYEKLLEAYIRVMLILYEDLNRVEQNISPRSHVEMERIPYYELDVQSALYHISEAKGISELPFSELIHYLEEKGWYTTLSYPDQNPTPVVYSMTLKPTFQSNLILKEMKEPSELTTSDYFINNNRLFLCPQYILQGKTTKTLQAFDIYLNRYAIEKNFGSLLGLDFSDLVTREDAKNIINAFEAVASSNLTIRGIKQAVHDATGWTTFDLQDYKSKALSGIRKRMYERMEVSPSTFFVFLPEQATEDIIKTTILYYLLDTVKEAHTTYFTMYDIKRTGAEASLIPIEDTFSTKLLKFDLNYDEGHDYDVADPSGFFSAYDS